MRNDIMIDIETLGLGVGCPILQIAAAKFDISTGIVTDTFNRYIDIGDVDEKIEVMSSTLKWWLETNSTLLSDIIRKGDIPLNVALYDLAEWMNYPDRTTVWGNGCGFDNEIVKHAMQQAHIQPWSHTCDRDMRTILDLGCEVTGLDKNELKYLFPIHENARHDALNDVLHQVDVVSYCYRALTRT